MRKILAIAGLAAVALLVFAQGSGSGLLSSFAKALNSAQSLSADYTVMRNLGAKEAYKVELAKPDKLKIDRPSELIVADGKTITTYDKVNKTYYQRPQTPADFNSLLSADELSMWWSFFDANLYAKTASRNLGKKNRKGMVLNVVEAQADTAGRKMITLYLSPDNIARQMEVVVKNDDAPDSLVVDTNSVTLGSAADATLFAFKPPAGSRMLTEDELNSNKWFTDLDEALKVAQRTKRLVMIDFYTEW